MSRPLSLTAYLALRRGGPPQRQEAEPRPRGRLVWLHGAPEAEAMSLAAHLIAETAASSALITGPGIAAGQDGPCYLRPTPAETVAEARAFLDHWRPDLAIWCQPELSPVLIATAGERKVPQVLVLTGEDAPRLGGGVGWMPRALGNLLDQFSLALVSRRQAAAALQRAGMARDRVRVIGPIAAQMPVLPASETDREDLARAIGTRAAWLVVGPSLAEIDTFVTAYRQARRRTHRLLMLLVPARAGDQEALAAAIRERGLSLASRAEGQSPEEETQVYLADGTEELGLWYRLAPITALGGTFAGSDCRHPYEAANLGSAILHGPRIDPHAPAFEALGRAGAARLVRHGPDLGAALEQVLSPDRAATLAQAAWAVVSEGAEGLNALTDTVAEVLAGNSGP